MNAPGPTMESPTGTPRRGTATLWIMVAIFAAPVLAAWFFYLNPEYLPAGRTNRGELIAPVVALPPDLGLTNPAGEAFQPKQLAGRWTLVWLSGRECTDACRKRLADMRQIRTALGDGSLSVERLLLFTVPQERDRAADLAAEFDGMYVAAADAAGGVRLLELLGEGADALGRIYILDPMGNLMMRYAPDAPAKDTLKDMERLLKASKSWIKGAQYGHK